MDLKQCVRCGEIKQGVMFRKNNRLKDGFMPVCKKCFNKQIKRRKTEKYNTIRQTRLKKRRKRKELVYLTTQEIRKKVLCAYCNYMEPYCIKCGFSNVHALQIDHINNNGSTDRKKYGIGKPFYISIIERNYPKEYQVLCANCNTIKERERMLHEKYQYQKQMFHESC
jgi:hypothetical protein